MVLYFLRGNAYFKSHYTHCIGFNGLEPPTSCWQKALFMLGVSDHCLARISIAVLERPSPWKEVGRLAMFHVQRSIHAWPGQTANICGFHLWEACPIMKVSAGLATGCNTLSFPIFTRIVWLCHLNCTVIHHSTSCVRSFESRHILANSILPTPMFRVRAFVWRANVSIESFGQDSLQLDWSDFIIIFQLFLHDFAISVEIFEGHPLWVIREMKC